MSIQAGGTCTQSLRNTESGANAFTSDSSLLSDTGYHYIGGLIEHGAPLSAFSNPTINGYKRLNANPAGAEPHSLGP